MKKQILFNLMMVLLLACAFIVFENRFIPSQAIQTPVLTQVQSKQLSVSYGEKFITLRATEADGSRPVTVAMIDAKFNHPLFSDMLSLSPDSQFVSYVTSTNSFLYDADLWVARTDGLGASKVVHFGEELFTVAPVWSIDSSRIAYIAKQPGSAPDGGVQLWVVDRDGQNKQLVLDGDFLTPALFEGIPHQVMHWPVVNTLEFENPQLNPPLRYSFDLVTKKVSQESIQVDSNTITEGGSAPHALPCSVPIFNQRNYSNNMSTCNSSISAAGCALSSTAMVFKYYGVNTDPPTLNSCLGNLACPIYWYPASSSCSEGKVTTLDHSATFDYSTIQNDLNAGKPVLVWMSTTTGGTHYVVVTAGTGTSPSGYTINDPGDGSTNKTLQNYVDAGWSLTSLVRYSGTPSCSSNGTEGGQINYGETKNASVNPARNYDDWFFNAGSGDIIEIRQNKNGSSLDSYVQLLDSSMNLIAYDDDSGGSYNSYLRRTLSSGGRYTIRAKGYGSSTGAYTLNLIKQSSPPACDGEGDPRNISFEQSLSGNLCNNADTDTFFFSATAGRAIQIDMIKSSSGLDSYLELYNSGGSRIAYNDDGAGNYNSRIAYTISSAGTYRIVARSYSGSSSGNYTVTLKAVGSNSGSGNLARGKPVTTSSIENPGLEGYRATDGNMGTRWASRSSDPQWMYIDLGTNRYINQVVLKWETAYGRSFGIYAKNNSACGNCWTNVYWTDSGRGGTNTINIPRQQYRYVLVYGTARGTGWGYSLWEVELYDTSTLTMPEVLPADPEKVADDNSVAPLPLAEPGKEILLNEFNGVLGQEELPLEGGTPNQVTIASAPPYTVFAYINSPDEGGLYHLSTNDGSILFEGLAQSSNASGPVAITAYSWRSDINGILSTQQSFSKMPIQLAPGWHTIYFKAQNTLGEWSAETSVRLYVDWPIKAYIPSVSR